MSTSAAAVEKELATSPDMSLMQPNFLFSVSAGSESDRENLLKIIIANRMLPFYQQHGAEYGIHIDATTLETMKEEYDAELAALDANIISNEQDMDGSELLEGHLKKLKFYANVGAKLDTLKQYQMCYDKATSISQKIDLTFFIIRYGYSYNDWPTIHKNLDRITTLIEETEGGSNWERKNKLKVYKGIYYVLIRNFKKAIDLFLDSLSTFNASELITYRDFIFLIVILAPITLSRVELKTRIMQAPEILEVIGDLEYLESLINSLYNIDYANFFTYLVLVDKKYLAVHRFLFAHRFYYAREMRLVAYAQLLQSYRSLSLTSMAIAFGVDVEFIDRDLARFIAAGRLACVIDKVDGVVVTDADVMRTRGKNSLYLACVKQGDLLFNRIQKLSRVIHL